MTTILKNFRREYEARHVYGMLATDWQERVNYDRLRKERLERARKELKKSGLGALLLFTGENIRYVTGTWDYGWRAGFFLRYCILPRDAEPILFDTAGSDIVCTKDSAPWLKDIRPAMVWRGAGRASEPLAIKFAEGVKKTLQDHGLAKEPLGADALDPYSSKALSKQGLQIADGSTPMRDARLIKTPDELEILKQACAVVDAAFYMSKNEWVKPGMTEKEVRGRVMNFVYEHGFDAGTAGCSSGGHLNPLLRANTDKIIRQGDWVTMDIVCQLNGYWTDYVRCWMVEAKPSQEQKELYKECYRYQMGTINACRPGNTTADVARALNTDEMYNVDERDKTRTLLGLVHSVGLRHHEDFEISRAHSIEYPEEIKPNMYFATETYVASPNGVDGVRMEDNYVITDNGPKLFSIDPYEEEYLQ